MLHSVEFPETNTIKQRKCMVIIYSYFISCLVKIRLKIYAARNYFLSNENTLRANGSEA